MFFKKGCTVETQGIVCLFFEALRSGTIGIKLQIMKNAIIEGITSGKDLTSKNSFIL